MILHFSSAFCQRCIFHPRPRFSHVCSVVLCEFMTGYWDEVELLGRCLYDFERVNCTSTGIGHDGERVVAGDGGVGDGLAGLLGGGGGRGGGEGSSQESEEALQLAMVSIMLEQQRRGSGGGGTSSNDAPLPWPPRFAGGFNHEEDWLNFDAVVRKIALGDYSRFSTLTFHKALPNRMALLAEQFAFDFDDDDG